MENPLSLRLIKEENNKKRKHRETGIAISPFLVDDWH